LSLLNSYKFSIPFLSVREKNKASIISLYTSNFKYFSKYVSVPCWDLFIYSHLLLISSHLFFKAFSTFYREEISWLNDYLSIISSLRSVNFWLNSSSLMLYWPRFVSCYYKASKKLLNLAYCAWIYSFILFTSYSYLH
jgi:hypothetical protein